MYQVSEIETIKIDLNRFVRLFPYYLVTDRDFRIVKASCTLCTNFGFQVGDNLLDFAVVCEINGHELDTSDLDIACPEEIFIRSKANFSYGCNFRPDFLETEKIFLFAGLEQSATTPPPYPEEINFGHVVDNLQKDIVISDKNGAIQWVNKRFSESTGFQLDEIKGRRLREVLQGSSRMFIEPEYVDKRIAGGKSFKFENVGYRKDESLFWFRVFVHPIQDRHKNPAGRYTMFEDINQIKDRDKDYYESLQLWKYTIEQSGHGLWSYNFKEKKLKASDQLKRILNLSILKEPDTQDILGFLTDDDRTILCDQILPGLNIANPSFSFEHRLTNPNGLPKYYLTKGYVSEFQAPGKPLILVGTTSEITDLKNSDQELRLSNERLSVLIRNLDEAILLEKEDRSLLLVNEQFCKLFQIMAPPEALVGYDCSQAAQISKHLFRDPEAFVRGIEHLLTHKTLHTGEILELADGRKLSRDFIPIHIDGSHRGHLWRYTDITEKAKAEQQTLDRKEYFNKVLNALPVDLVILDRNLKFEFVNDIAIKDPERRKWVIGKSNMDYCRARNLDPSLAETREKNLQVVVGTKQAVQTIEEFPAIDGSTQYVLRVLHPFLDTNGEIEFIIVYGIDISDQIKSKKFAEVQEGRIRNLLYIINDGVFRCDGEGTVILFNESFSKIMEAGMIEGDSSKLNFFDLLPASESIRVKEKIEILLATGEQQAGTFYVLDMYGERKYIDYLFTLAMRVEDAAFVGRISDVTAIVNKEKNLNEIIDKEKELNHSKSSFVRITSHELRTPLSIIRANAEILEMILETDTSHGMPVKPQVMLERINKGVILMTEILNRLLMVSKIEEGKIELQITAVNIPEFLREIKRDFFTPYTDGRELDLEIVDEDIQLDCDKNMLRHAIVNLVNNAFKYSFGKQQPMLHLKKDQDNLYFEIRDFGIGIPNEDLNKLFTSFFRASNVGVIQGTGLGLMVIDYVAKKLKGQIKVESKLNEGSLFTMVIPR